MPETVSLIFVPCLVSPRIDVVFPSLRLSEEEQDNTFDRFQVIVDFNLSVSVREVRKKDFLVARPESELVFFFLLFVENLDAIT